MSVQSNLHQASSPGAVAYGNSPAVWLLCGVAVLLSGCGGGGSTTEAAPTTQAASAPRPVSQSNMEIATLIYSDTQRTPAGFQLDAVPAFSGYVATSHLKTRDLNSNAVLQYELCSDDYQQALQWSETANAHSGDNAALLTTLTTAEYFEFDRLRNSTPQGYLRQRVYRCGYLNRATVDLQSNSGAAGILNVRPMDAATLKSLSEYLWQFTTYNNFGHVVLLSSGAASSSTALSHSLMIASLTAGGSSCDNIAVSEWKHSLDTVTGDLTLSITPLLTFRAQQSGGSVSVCSS